jgi:hypothetical protein
VSSFQVRKNGKVFDYRVGKNLDLEKIRDFFSRKYTVERIWQEKRHAVGFLKKDEKEFFVKIATTEGISIRTKTDKIWNDEFNKYSVSSKFNVPRNIEDGYFNGLYYIVMERFDGDFLCDIDDQNNLIEENIENIIDFTEHIQTLSMNIPVNDAIQDTDHREWFKQKTKSWLDNIPEKVINEYDLEGLWQIVEKGTEDLLQAPRHGDFAPWHIFVLGKEKLGLIDGEHAHSHGVENYDICYFIQRVHTVLSSPELAEKMFKVLLERGHDQKKIKTVLVSRAIGGFLDQFFNKSQDYKKESNFSRWVLKL